MLFLDKIFDNIDDQRPHLLVIPKISIDSALVIPQLLARLPQLYIIANISRISCGSEISSPSSQEIANFLRWCDSACPRINLLTDSITTQHEISICSGLVVESIADPSSGNTLDEKLSRYLQTFFENCSDTSKSFGS